MTIFGQFTPQLLLSSTISGMRNFYNIHKTIKQLWAIPQVYKIPRSNQEMKRSFQNVFLLLIPVTKTMTDI